MTKYTPLTQEEKHARDHVRHSDLAQRLIDGVKAIQTSADFIRMLRWQAAFYHYSARNVLLIMGQRPDAMIVAGFHRWRTLNRTVKKGAKGIMIYAPRIQKAECDGDDPTVFFGIEYVFDISDTDGDAPPTIHAPTIDGAANHAAYERLLDFAHTEGLTVITMPEHPTQAHGYYNAKHKTVYVEPANPAQMIHVLAHELAHHCDRANAVSREAKETIAEGAAHVFCAHIGLDTSSAAYPYIAGWSANEGGEKTILACLVQIQRIAKQLIDAAMPPADRETAAVPIRKAA